MGDGRSDATQYMVVFVLNDPNRLDEVLDAWYDRGIRGVTILESSGLFRRRSQTLGARYAFGFPRLFGGSYKGHFTLMAVVDSVDDVEICAQEVQALVGDLELPNTGMLTAWPVPVAVGTRPPAPQGHDELGGQVVHGEDAPIDGSDSG